MDDPDPDGPPEPIPAGPLPVTVVISRRPAPGREDDLIAWADQIIAAADRFPGHLGAQVFPPSPPDTADLVLAFSFSDTTTLATWEHSAERRQWLERARPLVAGEQTAHGVSGFEGIFFHERGRPVVPPPRWKTAVVIALALYPVSLLLSWALVPRLGDLHVALRVLVTTVLIVPYMAWLGVPWLSRWLHGWLHPGR